MSIERLQGVTTPTVKLTGSVAPRSPVATFLVQGAAAPAAVAPVSPLAAFRNGHITQEQYVEAKVSHAMEHVRALPATKRAVIADELRTRLVGGDLAHLLAGVSA